MNENREKIVVAYCVGFRSVARASFPNDCLSVSKFPCYCKKNRLMLFSWRLITLCLRFVVVTAYRYSYNQESATGIHGKSAEHVQRNGTVFHDERLRAL